MANRISAVGVFAGLVGRDKKLILVRAKGSNKWGLPGGGLEEKDPSIFHCLSREIKEELGLEISPEVFRQGEIKFFLSENPNIWDVAFVVRIEAEDGWLMKALSGSEIEEYIIIGEADLSTIDLIGPRMKRMIFFAFKGAEDKS